MTRLLAFFAIIASVYIAVDASAGVRYCQAKKVSDEYDRLYRAAVHKYYPVRFNTKREWCYVKAQAVVESGQNTDAVSPVGAAGVLQLMPGTLKEMAAQYGMNPRAHNAHINVQLGVAYMAKLFKFWFVDRTKQCHRRVTQASYNAGPGNILKAQVAAGGAPCWDKIGPALPDVTGRHAKETQDYIKRIEQIHGKLTK